MKDPARWWKEHVLTTVIWKWSKQTVVKLFLQQIRSEAASWSRSLYREVWGLKTPLRWRLRQCTKLFRRRDRRNVAKLGLNDVCILGTNKYVSLFLPGNGKSAFLTEFWNTDIISHLMPDILLLSCDCCPLPAWLQCQSVSLSYSVSSH